MSDTYCKMRSNGVKMHKLDNKDLLFSDFINTDDPVARACFNYHKMMS